MTWTRKDLKERAKFNLRSFYWKSVLVALVLGLISNDGLNLDAIFTNSEEATDSTDYLLGVFGSGGISSAALGLFGLGVMVIVVAFVLTLLLSVFVFGPLQVGCKRYFLQAGDGNADLHDMVYCFKNGYTNVALAQFLTSIFIFLWSLLLIVPGIIKSYSYRMIPYILADDPYMSFTEAKERSIAMMDGEKWKTFVLDLSFILWFILDAVTLGVAGLFWVTPYYQFTCAEQYKVLCAKGGAQSTAYDDSDISGNGYEF